jgi:hypothetical protein
VPVRRPDDHLVFDLLVDNLELKTDGSPRLERKAPGAAAYLIVEFPPQSFAEEAFLQQSVDPSNGTNTDFTLDKETSRPGNTRKNIPQPGEPVPPLPSARVRMAGRSRLAFVMPAGETSLPYTLAAVLNAMRTWPLHLDVTALPDPEPIFVRPGLVEAATLGDWLTLAIASAGWSAARAGLSAALESAGARGIDRALAAAADRIAERSAGGLAGGADAGIGGVMFEVMDSEVRKLQRRFPALREGPAHQAGIAALSLAATEALAAPASRIEADVGLVGILPWLPLLLAPHELARNVTALELPYRLILSPIEQARWLHRDAPVVHRGRTELWHTRLRTAEEDYGPDGAAKVRALWSPDYPIPDADIFNTLAPPPKPFRTSLDALDRKMLVKLMAGYNERRAANRAYRPRSSQAKRLHLSALGGLLDAEGNWNPRPLGVDLEQWRHVATLGRDHYVRVVYAGFLCPFGHSASLVKVTERKFESLGGDPRKRIAVLRQRFFIVVRERVKQYSGADHQFGGRNFPFTQVEILTRVTPDLLEPGVGPSRLQPAGADPIYGGTINTIPTTQVARRFAVPPQVSARDAEYHGKLDAGGKVDPTTFDLLANQKDLDARDPNAALVEERLPTQGPLGGAPAEAVFAVYRDGRALTYLPDPLAEVVAARIFGHPGIAASEIIHIPLYPSGGWPDAQPFTIEVFEDPTAVPHYDAARHALRIPLAKADRATVRLSMQLSKQAVREVMGLWRWIPASDQAALEPLALSGQHWMLTPWRTVEVVHAVQRPLIAPAMVRLAVSRGRNDTAALPRITATCSLKSTDRVDLLAEWHEPSDDPGAPGSAAVGVDRARGDAAFSIKITDPASYAQKLHGHARGGFAEHTIEGENLIGIGPGHDLVMAKHHEFHDTRYRRIEYWLEATTKFREYLPAGILTEPVNGEPAPSEKHIKVVGPRTVTWIPSSAPPPAPDVLYVVPTFGWVRTKDEAGGASSWRRGGGLRVYLDRPWNVSGYGEMLAVVLPPPAFSGDPDTEPKGRPYKKFVTQWGNDPIWRSPFVAGMAPKRADFPLARTAPDPAGAWLPKDTPATEADQPAGPFAVTGLLPPGVPAFPGNISVDVAPHDVFYHDERRLWYCDIEVNQGASYWPFIRLALARYQPVSVYTAHLSDVVLADFMPLAADRWLTVNRTGGSRTWRVAVFGHSYSDSSGHEEAAAAPSMSLIDRIAGTVRTLTPADVSPTSVVEVWVERLDPARGEDFGWERVPNAVVQPAGSAAGPVGPAAGALGPVAGPAGQAAAQAFRFVPADQITRALELHQSRRFGDLVAERLVDKVYLFRPLWEGTVTLPVEPAEDARFRLVIAEFEEYLVDDDRPYDKVPTKKDRRLVFVEHVEL